MRKKVTINITEDIIRRAHRTDCYSCMIGLALREATNLVWHVMPRNARIETLWGRKPLWIFPPAVRQAISRADSGEAVEPFSFNLPPRFADTNRWRNLGAGVDGYG